MKQHIIDGAMLVTVSDGRPAARMFIGAQENNRVIFFEHEEFRQREDEFILIAVVEQDSYIANATSYTLGSEETRLDVSANSGIYITKDGSVAVLAALDRYAEIMP